MTRKPQYELLDALALTVIDMMRQHDAEVAALRQEIHGLKDGYNSLAEAFEHAEADLEHDWDGLTSALSRALDPQVYREPVRAKKQRARERLREALRAETGGPHPPKSDPKPR